MRGHRLVRILPVVVTVAGAVMSGWAAEPRYATSDVVGIALILVGQRALGRPS